jgi:hypothetical protein
MILERASVLRYTSIACLVVTVVTPRTVSPLACYWIMKCTHMLLSGTIMVFKLRLMRQELYLHIVFIDER